MIGQFGVQLRTARLLGQHPRHRAHRLRHHLHFLVVDFVRSVRGAVIVGVKTGREERDRDAHLGEVVMVAAVEDALSAGLRSQIVVGCIGRGHIVEVIQRQLLIIGVHRLDGLLQIVARDIRSHDQDLAGIYQDVSGVGVGEARSLGPPDHVHVQVRHDLREIEEGVFGEVLRAPQALLFAREPREDDAALGAYSLGGAFGIRPREGQQTGTTRAIVVGAVIHVVAVGQRRGEPDMIRVRADHHVLVLEDRIAAFQDADDILRVIGRA